MALPLPVQDAELVTLARRGRDDAFAALYERYFPSVYDFLTRLLRDRQEAADVAQDTFIKAFERLGHLQKPESFKSWLFTIAHRNGLNRIEHSKRAVAVGDFYVSERESGELGVADMSRAGDPERSAEAQAAASLIWEAAAGLDPRTYAVMDLHVRQGLDSAEIAEVLGVSKGNAYTMVSRMKKSFSETLSTYLLVRNGSDDCEELSAIVAAQSASGLTPELRKAVDRHAKACEVCRENRKVLFMPIKMFAALGAAPLPAGLQAAIWGNVHNAVMGAGAGAAASGASSTGGAPTSTAVTEGAVATSTSGGAGAWAKSHLVGLAGAAVLIALLFVGGVALLSDRGNDDTQVLAGGATATSTSLGDGTQATQPEASTTSGPEPATTQAPQVAAPVPSTTLAPPVIETTSTTTTNVPPTTVGGTPLVVRGDVATVAEDSGRLIDVLGNDSGYAAGAAPEIASAPIHGTARVSGSSIWYAPAANYAGPDRMAYSIQGLDGTKRSAQIALTVTPVNDSPVVPGPGTLSIDEDNSVSFDPLAGAADIDGDTLVMVGYDKDSRHGGSISLGSLEYTPATNWFGSDTFSYRVSDGTVEIEVAVTINVAAINDLPSGPFPIIDAVEDGTGSGNILKGWSDVEGDMVFIANPGTRTTARGGSVTVARRGAATYTPPPDFSGSDNFTVSVSDGTDSVNVNVLVNVAGSNDPPIVKDFSFDVSESTLPGQVIGVVTAVDPEGERVRFEALNTSVIEVRPNGEIVLVEPLDFEEEIRHRLDVLAKDDDGGSDSFFVFVNVKDVDEAPAVKDTGFNVPADAKAGYRVGTVRATDPEGEPVQFALENAGGLVAINRTSGLVTLSKDVDPAVFPVAATIVVTDPTGHSARATLTLLLDDVDGPSITNFAVDVDAFYEPPAAGGVCSGRPRFATYSATVTDPTGVQSVDLRWRITVNGVEKTGGAKMIFVDDHYEIDFTAPRGILTDGRPSTLYARVSARDFGGNVTESAEIGVTLLPCNFD